MYANIEGFLTYRCMCDVFTRSNSVRNSRCYCYEDTNLGGGKMWCFHEGKFCSIFTMPLLCWHKFGWEKIHNAFTRCPWDLSLYPVGHTKTWEKNLVRLSSVAKSNWTLGWKLGLVNLTTIENAGRLVLMELAMKGQVFDIDFTLLSLNSQYNKVV